MQDNDLIDVDEELIEQMRNICVVNDHVTIKNNYEDLENLKWEMCLLGKFLTDKYINFIGLNDYLQMKWRPQHNMEMKRTDHGIYILQFHHQMDIQRVLNRSPWSFNKHLLMLTK